LVPSSKLFQIAVNLLAISDTLYPVTLANLIVASVLSITSLVSKPCWKKIKEASVYSLVTTFKLAANSLA